MKTSSKQLRGRTVLMLVVALAIVTPMLTSTVFGLFAEQVAVPGSVLGADTLDPPSGMSTTCGSTSVQVDLLGSWGTGLTHTVEAGSDRALVFIAAHEHGSSPAPVLTGVTYGGQALTNVNAVSVGTGIVAHVEIWILDEAGIGAAGGATFVPSWNTTPSQPMYSHAFFDDVDQASPTGAQATASSASASPNPITTAALATTSGADTVVTGAVAGNAGSYTPQNSFTLGNNQNSGSTVTFATAYKQAAAATETPSMTHSGPNRQVIAGAVLAAVSGGSVTLDWTATPDTYATGHRVLRSGSSGGPYSQIAQVTPRTTTSYVDDPAAGAYFYVVRAYSGGWESVDSNEDSAAPPGCGSSALDVRVLASSDDAEEDNTDGGVDLSSSDLELIEESNEQTVGIRFTGITIPKGADVTNAWIQFQTDETDSVATNLTIRGQAADDAATFTSSNANISSRPTTSASAGWSPSAWNTVGEAGPDQRTTDLSAVIEEIVGRSGWSSGNALVVIITGTGQRTAESYNGVASAAASLHVEYTP